MSLVLTERATSPEGSQLVLQLRDWKMGDQCVICESPVCQPPITLPRHPARPHCCNFLHHPLAPDAKTRWHRGAPVPTTLLRLVMGWMLLSPQSLSPGSWLTATICGLLKVWYTNAEIYIVLHLWAWQWILSETHCLVVLSPLPGKHSACRHWGLLRCRNMPSMGRHLQRLAS